MCNLYAATMPQDAMRGLFDRRQVEDRLGNLESREEVYPDQGAPIVRREGEAIILQNARWDAEPEALSQRERHRSGCDEHPEHRVAPLAALAGPGASLPRASDRLR